MDNEKQFDNDADNIIFLTDLDDALIGIGERIGIPPIAVYDSKKCVEILMVILNTTYEDALDYFYCNISGAYFGENTPIFIRFPE